MELFDKILDEIERTRQSYLEAWAGGGFTDEQSVDATAQMNAKALGKVQAFEEMYALIKEARKEYDADE